MRECETRMMTDKVDPLEKTYKKNEEKEDTISMFLGAKKTNKFNPTKSQD